MATDGALAIGIDLGTSGVKLVAIDDEGRVVARASRSYPTDRPEPDSAEQRVDAWLAACDEAATELGRLAAPDRWEVIGLSAMLPTLVSLDDSLTSRWPALTWEDGRAEPHGRAIADVIGDDRLYRSTGQRFDGRYLLAMHDRRARLGGFENAVWAVGAKDYLFFQLTGALVTDPSTAAGYGAYDLHTQSWDGAVLAAASDPAVPPVVPSSHHRGLLDEPAARWGARAGIPVVVGAADSVLGAYGLDVAPSAIAYIAGTSNVVLARSSTPRPDADGRYLVTPMADDGYGLEMDLMSTGSALAWLADLLGVDGGAAAVVDLASTADLETSPLVLPYLSPGEQGALWDPELVGAVEGMTLRTTRGELARGLLAGIVLESRRCIFAIEESGAFGESGTTGDGGVERGPIAVTGSGGASAVFRQDLADATGRIVTFDPSERDHSALGAALFAARSALGWNARPESAARVTSHPEPARAEIWAARFERHERLRLAQRIRISETTG